MELVASNPTIEAGPSAIGRFVCVQMPAIVEQTAGGIFLPPKAAEIEEHATMTGELKSVGQHCQYVSENDIGSTVYFGRYAGVMIEEGKIKYRLIDEDEIRAVSR